MTTDRIKKGDTYPYETQLLWADGSVIDLSTATKVEIILTPYGSTTPSLIGVCSIIDAQNGVVRYEWGVGETDVVGIYSLEFRITFNNGDVLTVPTDDDMFLWIME